MVTIESSNRWFGVVLIWRVGWPMVSTFFQEKIGSASQINFGQRKRICGQRSNREEMNRFCKIMMWWYREWATFTLLAIMSVELPLILLQQSPVAIGLIDIQPVTTGWLLLRLGWIIQACLHTARQIPSSILVSHRLAYFEHKSVH